MERKELKKRYGEIGNEYGEPVNTKVYVAKEADAVMDAQEERIKELEVSQPKWVSVKERMPKEGSDPVLVYNDADNEYDVMWCEKYGEYWEWSNGDVNVDRNAFTHWMPLPMPPKEEK